MDALSNSINLEVSTGRLEDVRIEEVEVHVAHNLYADDLALIIMAEMRNLLECQSLLELFGRASGLYCDWRKTKAAFIPAHNIPQQFLDLGWHWESDFDVSKLLGIPIAQHISESQMVALVEAKLDGGLAKVRKHPTSLIARMTISNHLIMSTLWYMLTIWAGEVATLDKL